MFAVYVWLFIQHSGNSFLAIYSYVYAKLYIQFNTTNSKNNSSQVLIECLFWTKGAPVGSEEPTSLKGPPCKGPKLTTLVNPFIVLKKKRVFLDRILHDTCNSALHY